MNRFFAVEQKQRVPRTIVLVHGNRACALASSPQQAVAHVSRDHYLRSLGYALQYIWDLLSGKYLLSLESATTSWSPT